VATLTRSQLLSEAAPTWTAAPLAGSGQEIIAKGFVLLLAGIPIYIGMRWWQQRDGGRTYVELHPSQSNGEAATNREVVVAAAAEREGRPA
jgi:hypothetical protein